MDTLVILNISDILIPFWPFLEIFDLFGEEILQLIHCGHLGHLNISDTLVPVGIWDILDTFGVKVRFGT